MKKALRLLILLFLIAILASCSNDLFNHETGIVYRHFESEDHRPYSYNEQYEGFNSNVESGKKTLDFVFEKPVEITLDVVTNSGRLGIQIMDSAGNEYFDEDTVSTNTYRIDLDKADTYTISLSGENHSGGFTIKATDK